MRLTLSRVGGLILSCLVLSACSLKDTADKMEDSTKRIEGSSSQLAERTEELLRSMRKVESMNMLDKARQELVATEGTTLKLQKAMVFFAAFEFQEWTGRYTDTPENLDELYALAIKLFFTSIDDLIDDDLPINPLRPNNAWKSVASLAVAMSYQDTKQKQALEDYPEHEPVSVYLLITKALEQESLVRAGQHVPQYVHRVLEWKQEALYLLQLRHNYFPAMVLARMTPFEESLWFQIKQRFWGSSVDLSRFTASQFNEWGNWLKEGHETQAFLEKWNVPVEFTDCIQASLVNLQMMPSPTPVADDEGFRSETRFLDQINIYTTKYLR